MLQPVQQPLRDFRDSFVPKTEYRLDDVWLEIPDARTAIFHARTRGPAGSTAWVRAWVSNEPAGTLADAELAEVAVGGEVTLTISYDGGEVPTLACIRIESTRFATKHTMHIELP